MKKSSLLALLGLLSFFSHCDNEKKACVIREWKIMDLYRNNYPPLIDTTCDDSIVLVNKVKIAHSFSDSVFNHVGSDRSFSLDLSGTYQVDTNTELEVNTLKYEIAKVTYLRNGYNIDQGFFLYVVKGKGVYIQQESHDKKLFLLSQVRRPSEEPENTNEVTDEMIKDTVLFPLPPR
jgi:hypothetical protein